MGGWASVENIADDVQVVCGQPFDDRSDFRDKLVGQTVFHNAADNGVIVFFFVIALFVFLNEFFHDIGEVLRQGFAHFGPGVFAGGGPADFNQTVNCQLVPVFKILAGAFLFDEVEFSAEDNRSAG